MNPQNTGSFGAATGGLSPELQAALQRRSQPGQGATNALTNTAPTMDPNTQPAEAPVSAAPQPQMQPSTPQPGANLPFDPSEVKIMLGAMNGHLKSISRMREMSMGLPPK